MPQQIDRLLEILDANNDVVIVLDAAVPMVKVFNDEDPSTLVEVLRFNSAAASLDVGQAHHIAPVPPGEDGHHGYIKVYDKEGKQSIGLSGHNGSLRLGTTNPDPGSEGNRGLLRIHNHKGDLAADIFSLTTDGTGLFLLYDKDQKIAIRAAGGKVDIGHASDEPAELLVRGNVRVGEGAAASNVFLVDKASGTVTIGAEGSGGELKVVDSNGSHALRCYYDAEREENRLTLADRQGRGVFRFNAEKALLSLGHKDTDGDLYIRDANDKTSIILSGGRGTKADHAEIEVGREGNPGEIVCKNGDGEVTIRLSGTEGQIHPGGAADAAEHFDLAPGVEAAPGTVMVLRADGRLVPSERPYDQKVVGVVSGAGSYRPAIVLDKRDDPHGCRVPVSLMGKVACSADASFGSIEVGDLLSTSPTKGCAMRVSENEKSSGAVIGKALSPLSEGTGLVDMLIMLR